MSQTAIIYRLGGQLSRVARALAPRRTPVSAAIAPGSLAPYFGRKLVVVDVGCRWGFADAWVQLCPHVTAYGFDPDAAECDRLRPLYRGRDVTLVPQALADAPGTRTLYLTENAACSSLYRPDPVLTRSMPHLACAVETGTTEVEVTTLDAWADGAGVPQIDFIKLDTQGSELDILRGGERVLPRVRALEIEVEFNRIYQNQPLFGDVDRFMRDRDFVLWKLSSLAHYPRGDAPPKKEADDSTYYGSTIVHPATFGGQLLWGHAHYIRPEMAAATVGGDWRQIVRDAALVQALQFTDLAERLLSAAVESGAPATLASHHLQKAS